MVPFIQLKKLSQQRLANNNDATDQTLLWLILSPAMEWLQSYSPYQRPLIVLMWMGTVLRNCHVNQILAPIASSNIVASVTTCWCPQDDHQQYYGRVPTQGWAVSESSREKRSSFFQVRVVVFQWSNMEAETGLTTDYTSPSYYHAINITLWSVCDT